MPPRGDPRPRLRPRPPLSLAFALALALALVGCFGPPTSPVKVTPVNPLVTTVPGEPVDVALVLESTSAFKQGYAVGVADAPEKWALEPETSHVDLNGSRSMSLLVRVTPDANSTYGLHSFFIKVGETRAEVLVNVDDAANASSIPPRVRFAAIANNGTVLATNDPAIRDAPGIHLAPGAWNGSGEPIDAPSWNRTSARVGQTLALRLGAPDARAFDGRLDVDVALLLRVVP